MERIKKQRAQELEDEQLKDKKKKQKKKMPLATSSATSTIILLDVLYPVSAHASKHNNLIKDYTYILTNKKN